MTKDDWRSAYEMTPRSPLALMHVVRAGPCSSDDVTVLINRSDLDRQVQWLLPILEQHATAVQWDALANRSVTVQALVASSRRCPSDVLLRLAVSPNMDVRENVFANPTAPEEARIMVALQPRLDVVDAAVPRAGTPCSGHVAI
jgi:hypothetical protein